MLTLIETYNDFREYSAKAEYVSRTHPTLSVPTANDAYFWALRDDTNSIIGGYGIQTDGTIIGLFSIMKGYGDALVQSAIDHGGTRLECFEGVLSDLYTRHGFSVSERYTFDPVQAPDNWDATTLGTPDYLVMSR